MIHVTSLATSALMGAAITATAFMILGEGSSTTHDELTQAQSELQRYKTEIETLKTALDASQKQAQLTAAREAAVVAQARTSTKAEGTGVPAETPSPQGKTLDVAKAEEPPMGSRNHVTSMRMKSIQMTDESGNDPMINAMNDSKELIKTHLQQSIDLTEYEWEQMEAILKEKDEASTLLFTDGEPAEEFQKRIQAMSEPGADPALKQEMETKMIQKLGTNLVKLQELEKESNQKIRNLLGDTRYEEYRKTPLTGGGIRIMSSTTR